ncbi:acyltransferase [Mucilaginibacter sp.]|uniref:acyltransferase family protein n=1 Tax=Mucilaginibacter sp. TaxID=1882438 RepID=UPI003266A0D6
MPANNNPSHRRIKTLDSLRGFAALSVVFGHGTGGFYFAKLIDNTPFYITRAGHEAVIFFFMLSGYVLVYQYSLTEKISYGKFLLLRYFRLYIPYIASIALALILMQIVEPGQPNNLFMSQLWQLPLTPERIIGHILLVGNFNTSVLNPVIWSLVHEMRFAILFPPLLWILNLRPAKMVGTLIIITLVSAGLLMLCTYFKYEDCNGYFATPYYIYMFLAGGYIAKNQSALVAWFQSLNKAKKVIITIIAVLFYTYAHMFTSAIANSIYIPLLMRSRFLIEDLIIALASFYFIVAAISINNTKSLLERPVPLFFGKISYSLYLVHSPVLGFLYFALRNQLPAAVILIIGFGLCIPLAAIFNRYVEQGLVNQARRFLNRNSASGK